MKAIAAVHGVSRYLELAADWPRAWASRLAWALTIGIVYFFAARIGLAHLSAPSDVAVFWPAAGIAAGILITFGRRALPAVFIGVAAATVAANLLSDRSLWTSIFKGFCNAGEAVLVAWLLERWLGPAFTFGDLTRVLGFLAAAAVATALSAIGGAATMTLFYTASPFLEVWRAWFLSDGVGIVVVAPLVIGLSQMWRERPSRDELIEGAGVLALLTFASFFVVNHATGSWVSFSPGAVVLPLLLWLAARCPPPLAIAGAFSASMAVIYATNFGVGRFGDVSVPIQERVKGAQVAVTMVTVYTLVLTALFAERRRNEAQLKQSNNRLQLALDCAELGTWSLYLSTRRFENDARDRRIHGHALEELPQTIAGMRSQVHPDDLPNLDAAFVDLRRTGGNCSIEYRLARPDAREHDGRERWVALEGTIVRNADDRPMQLLGVTRDISDRKLAEEALAERNLQLALAGRAALVGTYAYDRDAEILQVSEGYAAIHGFPEGTTRIARDRWLAGVHPEDIDWLERRRSQAFQQRQPEYSVEYRIVHPGRGVRWIEARSFALYDGDGLPRRVVGVNIDVTERKQAEQALAERNVQFALAAKTGLVGSYAYDTETEIMQISEGYAAIHGFPEGTAQIARSECLASVHPDDIVRVKLLRSEAFHAQRREYHVEYRIFRPGGELRWVETRCFISYGGSGNPKRVVGVTIDITERKRVEEQQRALVAELDHRVKNSLATVSAVVAHSQNGSESMADFAAALNGRIRAMAITHELLSASRWQGVALKELVRRELAPFAGAKNIEFGGPSVLLRPEAVQAISMVLHELSTNAAKHGALSITEGRVSIRWEHRVNGQGRSVLAVKWQESGGPPILAPGKANYGTSTIRDIIPYELHGTVLFELARDGVRCRLELPAEWLDQDHSGTPHDASMIAASGLGVAR